MRRDWWGRALAALMGLWVAGMITAPASSRVNAPIDLLRAQRAFPDRTRVVSASEAPPESERTPPAGGVARASSPVCGDGGRRVADKLPTPSIVEFACVTRFTRVEVATASRRHHAAVAHILPPALGPPTTPV